MRAQWESAHRRNAGEAILAGILTGNCPWYELLRRRLDIERLVDQLGKMGLKRPEKRSKHFLIYPNDEEPISWRLNRTN